MKENSFNCEAVAASEDPRVAARAVVLVVEMMGLVDALAVVPVVPVAVVAAVEAAVMMAMALMTALRTELLPALQARVVTPLCRNERLNHTHRHSLR